MINSRYQRCPANTSGKDLQKFGRSVGDWLFSTEAPDAFRVTAHDPNFVEKMIKSVEKVMRRYRNTLRKLAR